MTLVPRVALLLERHEADALAYLQCWTNAVRRMEEKRRGELRPAEHGGDEIPPGATISGDGRRQAQ